VFNIPNGTPFIVTGLPKASFPNTTAGNGAGSAAGGAASGTAGNGAGSAAGRN